MSVSDRPTRVLIMGAAGRDFHNFNVFFRANGSYDVAAFTATQIPNIAGRIYPPDLAGPRHKVDTAARDNVVRVRHNLAALNPRATIVEAESPLEVFAPEILKGQRILAVEDGPTLTHGGMRYGAAFLAAQRFGAATIVDPRPYPPRRVVIASDLPRGATGKILKRAVKDWKAP